MPIYVGRTFVIRIFHSDYSCLWSY